jgi:uncharacterized membrane protein (UPF0127 family)
VTFAAARLACAAALAAAACPSPSGGPPAPALPDPPQVVLEIGGKSHSVTVEVADDEQKREMGLMFRRKLDPDRGMLFVFPEEDEHVFWMKNTLVPLDMIFIDGRGRVAGVVSRATPLSLEPRSAGRSRYVLEVAGGWAEERGVKAGDRVLFRNLVLPASP